MNELPAYPSRLLRATAMVFLWLWRLLLAVALLLLTSWGLLHGWIVPRIGDFKPTIERHASQALGLPVRIGGISAKTVWLVPSFELSDVALIDAQGQVALLLPRVVAALSPRSVLRLGFEQLYIDRPELDIRRAKDGHVWVAGLDLNGPNNQDPRVQKWFFGQTEFVIHQGQIRWTDEQRVTASPLSSSLSSPLAAPLPPVTLSAVNLLVRNTARRHALHLDAAVPPEWGSHFSVDARLRQPLFGRSTGDWRDWTGQVFAHFDRIDVSRLRHYVASSDLGLDIAQGNGAMRLWVDLSRGKVTGVTADVALAEVSASLAASAGRKPEPITLRSISGRLSGKRLPNGFEFSTQALKFLLEDGRQWPGGNVAMVWRDGPVNPKTKVPEAGQGELHADQLDLAALHQMANLLPLNATTHAALQAYAPQGVVEKLDAHWTRSAANPWPTKWDAKGRVVGLQLTAGEIPTQSVWAKEAKAIAPKYIAPKPGRPGIRGAAVDFDATQAGGKATLSVQNGSATFPGIFDDPVVKFDALSAELDWQALGDKLAVQAKNLRFANTDTQGEAQVSWHTSDLAKSNSGSNPRSRFPGVLDLKGRLTRGDLAQVHRYLPLVLHPKVRDYVRAAVLQGKTNDVQFRVKGDVHDIPFRDARLGEFVISVAVQDGSYAYVPTPRLAPAPAVAAHPSASSAPSPTPLSPPATAAPAWPALAALNGDLVFERVGMQLRVASSRVEGLPGLLITKAEAQIPDLAQAVVQVTGEGRGPLAEGLALVTRSPVGGWTNHVLAHASATGNVDYKLRLSLPLHELDKSKVQGSVLLAGNDFVLNPGVPPFSHARGTVTYTESGFGLQAVQAGFLGGDMRVDGGTAPASTTAEPPAGVAHVANPPPKTSPNTSLNTPQSAPPNTPNMLQFRAQGSASADGLRQAHALGWLANFARYASGSTNYTATLALRRGLPELTVQSNLQGVALTLPPPLNKAAEAELPLRYENTLVNTSLLPGADGVVRLQDQLRLDVGGATPSRISYVRDLSTPEPRVLRGAIAVGTPSHEPLALPETGVAANLQLGDVDVDAWTALADKLAAAPVASPVATLKPLIAPHAMAPGASTASPPLANTTAPLEAYLPTVIAVRAHQLFLGGHGLKNLVLGGSRVGLNWRANVDADELSGYLEYGQPSGANAGRVYARLARLAIAPTAATQVEALLKEQPLSIPALDIVVDDFDLRGKKLGRVEIDAVNTRALPGETAPPTARTSEWRLNKFNVILPEATFAATGQWAADASSTATRRTVMDYKLDITNAGELLARFGMKEVVRRGKGQLAGQVSWMGSPLALDYPSLGGQFNVNVENGQFLKADPGIAKLLGVLSLQSLPRRLVLDFRDVFSEGFAFDFLRGDVKINKGIAATNNLQMKGVNAAVLMEGRADIARETQDLKVVVVPEIDAGTASLVASVINPLIGITTFLTQLVLRRPFTEAATQEFHVDGSWTEPRVTKVEHKAANPAAAP